MTSSFNRSGEPLGGAGPDRPQGAEQRREGRVQTVYLPCCVRAGARCGVGLVRNVSPAGLMVETAIESEPGGEIDYFLDSSQWRRGRVVWRDGNRLGVLNLDEDVTETATYPYRAIRVPTSLVGRIWHGDRSVEIGIANISSRGVLAFGVPPLPPGALTTLTVVGKSFANTSLRWWADGSAGLQFERPMTLRALTELLEAAAARGPSLHYERRIGKLLEVVPANDPRN
jgi:hypothetical protein